MYTVYVYSDTDRYIGTLNYGFHHLNTYQVSIQTGSVLVVVVEIFIFYSTLFSIQGPRGPPESVGMGHFQKMGQGGPILGHDKPAPYRGE